MFHKSAGLDFVISVDRRAYLRRTHRMDTQWIKEMYSAMDDGTVAGRKAVMGRYRSISTSSACCCSCCASLATAAKV